ncbi:Ppx/GppA family phosphatase [Sphingorhabdus arenilitoris]|uniref:Ppx/GppA family phosphatase n=1 Tax=Sphingorhabdus arenilitoris TaxID=1490041 RepID=A0ABV8RIV4_9SPHN
MRNNIRRAIIDIGSNSIRLVVYGGPARAPTVLYNEKFLAGLGRGVIATGALDPGDAALALQALARFAMLVKLMQVEDLQVAATAAVRDASDGPAFVQKIRELGLPVKILSGEEEAAASGMGVISALPIANGIVVDLGGGSMELVRVSGGEVHESVSLNLGILRVPEFTARGGNALRKHLQKLTADIPWLWRSNNLPLYLVGGSWRALARVHIHVSKSPLPIIGNYVIPCKDVAPLVRQIQEMDEAILSGLPAMPQGRVPMLHDAALLLAALNDIISPSKMRVCAFGLREGLLFQQLDPEERRHDPLIVGARAASQIAERFPGFGDALAGWLDGLFPGEAVKLLRLRHAACLLADLGWSSNPEFRALSGEELALHGNWVGVTARDRTILATALYATFGGTGGDLSALSSLIPAHISERARIWGLAIRLGHRLSGGTAEILGRCPLKMAAGDLVLTIPPDLAALDSESIRGRLAKLADAMGVTAQVHLG